MRIFALETNRSIIIDRYCSESECVLSITRYHGMLFFIRLLREVLIAIMLITVILGTYYMGAPIMGVSILAFILFFFFVFIPVAKFYIDWRYDFLFITSDKIVLVDQTSIFRQQIKPIHIENIGSIAMQTQWLGLFNFGKITIQLKEGEGGSDIVKKYVPNPEKIAETMSRAVTEYQRGQYTSRAPANRPYVSTTEINANLAKIKAKMPNEL